MRHTRKTDGGLTLIELVVAMAIFALIAVMGLQALTGAMRMRDRLADIDTDTAELGLALGLLRADLGAVAPLLFYPPDGPPLSALRLDPAGRVLGLSLAGQPSLPARPGPGLQRAEWRLDAGTGTLSRRVWPVLHPAEAGQAAPEVVLMTGLRGWSLRTYWEGIGWVAGSTGNTPAIAPEIGPADDDEATERQPESYSSILPEAVELTLQTAELGEIVLVESLK
ncbi:prepilin-type N-terminal cleavage/methylation domain-containing protein [Thalassococcus profundi]|uniref:Type II secretion system protein J n=1 Tax=Thalassococcus profundi TaxID=2282382 RepID=A0A369TFA4_9RHOB|nr:type II secretion system protein GspJ [Thalassococcus profundi]RDD64029.1 prepilin-type N-terminal cleavage/methylation domain-containing protein [Thalassococcus profundi]